MLSVNFSAFFMHYTWCNTLALRTLNCRTNTCRNHGYNAVADDSCAGSHLLSWNRHPLATKVRKVEKVKILGPYVPYGLFQTKGEMCTKFGSDWLKNVNLYKVQPNKQTHKETNKNKKKTFNFIYKIYHDSQSHERQIRMTVVQSGLNRRHFEGMKSKFLLNCLLCLVEFRVIQ
jgi:hypothetical protein